MGACVSRDVADSEVRTCRDTFYDHEEGDAAPERLLRRPIRQCSSYGALLMNRVPRAAARLRRLSCLERGERQQIGDPEGPAAPPLGRGISSVPGSTIPQWSSHTPPPRSAHWSKGDGTGFSVRAKGYDGCRNLTKEPSSGCLYDCTSVDIIRSDRKIEGVIGSLTHVERQGSWAYSLPRVLCVNVQLPYKSGWPLMPHPEEDHGCSVVAFFHIKPATLKLLEAGGGSPPCLRLFEDFVRGGCTDLPNAGPRKLGLFKAIALCENMEEISDGIPWLLKKQALKQNGKATLVTQSGRVRKDPKGEWAEVSIDVRRFCFPAKEALVQLHDRLSRASIHIGFLVQGVGDDNLPEGLLCDLRLHNVDLAAEAAAVSTGPARGEGAGEVQSRKAAASAYPFDGSSFVELSLFTVFLFVAYYFAWGWI